MSVFLELTKYKQLLFGDCLSAFLVFLFCFQAFFFLNFWSVSQVTHVIAINVTFKPLWCGEKVDDANCNRENIYLKVRAGKEAGVPWLLWVSWLGIVPQSERWPVQFLVRTQAGVAGCRFRPQSGRVQEGTDRCFSPSLCPSLSISKNK